MKNHSQTLAVFALAMGAPFLPSCATPASHVDQPEVHAIVTNDYAAARTAAAAEGRLLLINSTSSACANCSLMEGKTFKDPIVAKALTQFVEARLYSDTMDSEKRSANQGVLDTFVREKAVPVYVAVNPMNGHEVARWSGASFEPAEFAQFLDAAAAAVR